MPISGYEYVKSEWPTLHPNRMLAVTPVACCLMMMWEGVKKSYSDFIVNSAHLIIFYMIFSML